MTGEKKAWGLRMSETERKKYKLAVRMVKGGLLFGKYKDVALNDEQFKLNDICKVIDGTQVLCVRGKYKYNNQ